MIRKSMGIDFIMLSKYFVHLSDCDGSFDLFKCLCVSTIFRPTLTERWRQTDRQKGEIEREKAQKVE